MDAIKFLGKSRSRLLAALAVAAVAVSVVGCSSTATGEETVNSSSGTSTPEPAAPAPTESSAESPTSSSDGGTDSEPSKTFNLLMAKGLLSGPYLQTESCGMIDAANARGANIDIVGPTDVDVQAQLNALEAALVKNPDGVGISAFSATAFNAATESMMASGIPVISVGAPFEPSVEYMTIYTKSDEVAAQLTPHIMEALPQGGKIAIIASSPGNDIDEQRYVDLIKLIGTERSDVTVLPVEYTNNETAKSQTTASALIQAHPDLSVIYATGDPSAAGVIAAVKSADKVGDIEIFAFDASPVEVQAVREGVVKAIAAQSPYLNGWMTVDALLDYLEANGAHAGPVVQGNPFFESVPAMILTQDNVDSDEGKKFHYEPSCDAG